MDKTVWSVKFVNLITHLAVFTRSVLSCFCFSSLLKSSTKCLPVHLFHAALISMCSIGHKWLASNANIQNDCWLWKQIVIELTDQITGEAKVWLPSTSPEMWALNEEKEGASNFWRRSYLTHPTLIKIMKPCYLILPCIVSIHLLKKKTLPNAQRTQTLSALDQQSAVTQSPAHIQTSVWLMKQPC